MPPARRAPSRELSLNSPSAFRTRSNRPFRLPQRLVSDSCPRELEILALRHQISVLQRSVKRPKLTAADRFFWAWISSAWNGWESRVSIIKAATASASSVRAFVCSGAGGFAAASPAVRQCRKRFVS